MKIRNIVIALSALSLAVLPVSCKKDKKSEGTIKDYFSGTLKFDAPDYARPGETYILVPSGVSREDGDKGKVGYYWSVAAAKTVENFPSVKDTTRRPGDPESVTGEYKLVIPDQMISFTVVASAYSEGYYNATSTTHTVVVVDPDKSFTNVEFPSETFTDARDGAVYPIVEIGGKYWMAKNLGYAETGVVYSGQSALNEIFGCYYTAENAASACPEGWALPMEEDWDAVAQAMGAEKLDNGSYKGLAGDLMADSYFNGVKMWEYWPDVKITNKSGFAAMPFGLCSVSSSSNSFRQFGEYAAFWTGSRTADGNPLFRYIIDDQPDVYLGLGDEQSVAVNIRCVRK